MTVAAGIELVNGGGADSMHATELCGVAVDNARNGEEPGFAIGTRRLLVRLQDCLSNGNCKRRLNLVASRRYDPAFAPHQSASFRPPIRPERRFPRFRGHRCRRV